MCTDGLYSCALKIEDCEIIDKLLREFVENILNAPRPGDALADAIRRGATLPVFLDDADKISAGPKPFHSGSLLAHMGRCMNACAGDPLAVWLALCHDAGKLTTPASMLPHHYGHEAGGEQLARVWARQSGLPPEYEDAGAATALLHMRAAKYVIIRPGKKLKLLNKIFPEAWSGQFWQAVDADCRFPVSVLARCHWRQLQTNASLSENDKCQLLKQLTPQLQRA